MDQENMRPQIAILTSNTLENRKRSSWGGTVDRMTQALQTHCGDVYHLGAVRTRKKVVGKVIHKASRFFLKKNYLYNHTFSLARSYARIVSQRLAGQPFDVIIAPSGGTEIAFLETNIPILLIEDANFALLHNYYSEYSHLLKRSVREVNALEELALKKARLVLHPSEWAARSTIQKYHTDGRKVHVVPFGANLDTPPSPDIVLAKKRSDRCRLFFLGVDWVRKGGEIAFEALVKLNEMGIHTELTICGCTPPGSFSHEGMTVIPYLDKRDENQRKMMEKLFETSDFLFLPTRSECYGMVFCEASAFGLPIITTNTGGVSGAVREGENGFMLPLAARGAAYAEVIAKIYRDEQRYAELLSSTRAAFDDRLNWDAWGMSVNKLITEMLDPAHSQILSQEESIL